MSKFSKIVLLIIIAGFGVSLVKIHNDKQKIDTPKKSINSSDENADSSKKDYQILVSSNKYNAIVSLNEDTKNMDIKILDNAKDVPTSIKYIKVSDEYFKYLEKNSDTLFNKLESDSLITKYALNEKLKDCDTNITSNDLKDILFKYVK